MAINHERKLRNPYLKKRCSWDKRVVMFIFVMLLGTIVACIIEYELKCKSMSKDILSHFIEIQQFTENFFSNQNTYIMDAFSLIWGMTITLILFLMEFHNTYWYGITLRNIINLSLKKEILIFGVMIYIMLCPLVYITEIQHLYIVAMWGIICTFAVFIMIPICIFCMTGKNKIIELLNYSTIDQIRKKVSKEEGVQIGTGCKKEEGIQIGLEELSITSMIEHLEYEDIVEVRKLLETLADLFVNWDILSLIQGTIYEHSVIMTWTEKIIIKSGTETDYQCKRTLYIVSKLWEKIAEHIFTITENDENADRRDTLMLSCLIELLLPLIKLGTEQSEKVFWGVWKKIRYYQAQASLYLLLYIEFLHYERINFYSKVSYKLLNKICPDKSELEKECKIWNQDLALKFWMCWTSLWDSDNNIAISFFLDFRSDIELIAVGKPKEVNTPTIRRIILRRVE